MSDKNFLEKLLEGAGVEWKKLGEVCEILKGKQLNKTELWESGKYPAYNGGTNYSGFTNKYNVEKNTTIISQGGASAGFVQFIGMNFWANAHCYYLKPQAKIVNKKYVFYFVKSHQKILMDFKYGAGIPALNASKISNLQIPIPCPEKPEKSLAIQKEIVRILDKFTELKTELKTEQTLRQKQYEYYRDLLLNFPKQED